MQYQKVTNVVQKAEKSQWRAAERLPAEQKLLQWRLPDIKNVLASSPGKSKIAIREKKRLIEADKTSQDEHVQSVETAELAPKAQPASAEKTRVAFYPKVTSTVLRS